MLFSPVYIASDLRPLVSLRSTSPVFLLTDHSPLITAHYCFKSFSCNTYGSPYKCCKQKTYGQAKPFRCNTYKKQGGGGPVFDVPGTLQFPSWFATSAAGGTRSLHLWRTCQPRSTME